MKTRPESLLYLLAGLLFLIVPFSVLAQTSPQAPHATPILALRLANSDILPFDFAANAAALREFLGELESLHKITPQQLPLKQLYERIANFETAGRQLREVTMRDLAFGKVNPEKVQHLNEQLLQVESNWLDPAGIPGRPWFQHILYSARYTYAHLEFPGLTEAVEGANWKLAGEQVNLLDATLVKNTELLRSAKSSWEEKQ